MRERKFRGKIIDNSSCEILDVGEWYFGDLIHYNNGDIDIVMTKTGHSMPVDPDSVGQFTEKKDKNGKEIYEGDVIRSKIYPNKGAYSNFAEINLYLVKYESAMAAFVLVSITCNGIEKGQIDTLWQPAANIEVIGNILDNPELLEGDKKL